MSRIYGQNDQRRLIETLFLGVWDEATYPVLFENEVLDPSLDPIAWVRLSMPQADISFDTFGLGTKTSGLVIVQLFTSKTGSSAIERGLVDIISDLFTLKIVDTDGSNMSGGSFYFEYPSISYGINSASALNDGFKQTNISINYISK